MGVCHGGVHLATYWQGVGFRFGPQVLLFPLVDWGGLVCNGGYITSPCIGNKGH